MYFDDCSDMLISLLSYWKYRFLPLIPEDCALSFLGLELSGFLGLSSSEGVGIFPVLVLSKTEFIAALESLELALYL